MVFVLYLQEWKPSLNWRLVNTLYFIEIIFKLEFNTAHLKAVEKADSERRKKMDEKRRSK